MGNGNQQTVLQVLRATDSERGLRRHCTKYKYKPSLCGKQLESLANITMAENQRMWILALEKAKDYAATELEVLNIAESLMIDDLFCPPHYTGYIICDRCGPMPALPEHQGENVICCQWCHSL